MRCQIIAVASRPSAWVATATDQYIKRLPRAWQTRIDLVTPSRQRSPAARAEDEWRRVSEKLAGPAIKVLLDERGQSLSSRALALRLADWQAQGGKLALLIGGPDGFAPAAREAADMILSLSALTLPHELARVVLVEQLYRAWSINEGHPYHRD